MAGDQDENPGGGHFHSGDADLEGTVVERCKSVLDRVDAFLLETTRAAECRALARRRWSHWWAMRWRASLPRRLFQALTDVGFIIPANAGIYRVGEAVQDVNYVDLDKIPDKVSEMIEMAVSNAGHLARLLRQSTYPASPGSGTFSTLVSSRVTPLCNAAWGFPSDEQRFQA